MRSIWPANGPAVTGVNSECQGGLETHTHGAFCVSGLGRNDSRFAPEFLDDEMEIFAGSNPLATQT